MGFKGEQLAIFELPLSETDPNSGPEDVVVYNVAVHMYRNGHTCTYLGLIDSSTKKFLSERLGCYDVPVRSRMRALLALYSAVIQACRDEGMKTG